MDNFDRGPGKRDRNWNMGDGPMSKRPMLVGMPSTLRVLLRSIDAGGIIGKGGENIKRMRKKYDCQVQLPDSAGNPERVLTVIGDKEGCIGVFEECLEKVKNEIRRRDMNAPVEVQVLIPQPFMGTIIGTGGMKIKELRKNTNCNIKIFSDPMPYSNERSISLTGTESEIISCVSFFLTEIGQREPKEPIILYDPSLPGDMPPPFGYHPGQGYGGRGGRGRGRGGRSFDGGRGRGNYNYRGGRGGGGGGGHNHGHSHNQSHHPSPSANNTPLGAPPTTGPNDGPNVPPTSAPSQTPHQPPQAPPQTIQYPTRPPNQPPQAPVPAPAPVGVVTSTASTGYPTPPISGPPNPPQGFGSYQPPTNPPQLQATGQSHAPSPLVNKQPPPTQYPQSGTSTMPPSVPSSYPPQAPPTQPTGYNVPTGYGTSTYTTSQPSYAPPTQPSGYANTVNTGYQVPPQPSYPPPPIPPTQNQPYYGGQYQTPPNPVFPAANTLQQTGASSGYQPQSLVNEPQTKQVTIPHEYASAILGSSGTNLQQIRTQSRCNVVMEDIKPNSAERIISITGLPGDIAVAEQLMKDSVRQHHKV